MWVPRLWLARTLLAATILLLTGCSADSRPRREDTYYDVWINIVLSGEGFASSSELELRDRVEQLIVERSVGEVVGAGSGLGTMDISVQVLDRNLAQTQISQIMEEVDPDVKYSLQWFDSQGNPIE